jgi:Protein of unknown function (DUF3892)
MSIRITCITKAGGDHENPYVAISRLGWVNLFNPAEKSSSTRQEMFDFVMKGGEAFVYDRTGTIRSKLICATSPKGTKYVTTQADSTKKDNLLELGEC